MMSASELKPYSEYKETSLVWYPRIPSHWQLMKLKHVSIIHPSNVNKKSYEGDPKVRLANYVDVYYNDEIRENLDLMSATATEDEISKFTLMEGDVIITKDSETWDDIAVPALVPQSMPGVVCGYHLTLIRPIPKFVIGEFLFRTFQAIGIRDQYHYNANGVTRYGLGSYWVNNGIIPIPPLDEQKLISEFINDKVDTIRTLNHGLDTEIGTISEYRTALITAAVTGVFDLRCL